MSTFTDTGDQQQVYYHGTQRVFDTFQPNTLGLIHFSACKYQAREFAEYARGPSSLAQGPKRVIGALLNVGTLLDTQDKDMLTTLSDHLDWRQAMLELEEFSQSPWDIDMAQKWLKEGQWQLMELPCVLEYIKQHFDGIVMFEMGVRNIAVFSPNQIQVISDEIVGEPKASPKL